MPKHNKSNAILQTFSELMAAHLTDVPPKDWLRLSATLALTTIELIDAPMSTKHEIADQYCDIFKESVRSRMGFQEFMDKIVPPSLN